jgi:hypothetical protein
VSIFSSRTIIACLLIGAYLFGGGFGTCGCDLLGCAGKNTCAHKDGPSRQDGVPCCDCCPLCGHGNIAPPTDYVHMSIPHSSDRAHFESDAPRCDNPVFDIFIPPKLLA